VSDLDRLRDKALASGDVYDMEAYWRAVEADNRRLSKRDPKGLEPIRKAVPDIIALTRSDSEIGGES